MHQDSKDNIRKNSITREALHEKPSSRKSSKESTVHVTKIEEEENDDIKDSIIEVTSQDQQNLQRTSSIKQESPQNFERELPKQIRLPPTSFHERLTLLPILKDPRTYHQWQKNLIVFTLSVCALGAPFACSVIFPTFRHLKMEFAAHEAHVNLSITLFLIALGISPIWWSFLSAKYGKRPIYLISFAIFMISSIICSLSNSLAVFLIFRFIQGIGSSSGPSVGAGTIADIILPTQRGTAFGYFYLGPLLGPLSAPIIGGALDVKFGWRSCMFLVSIFAAIMLIVILLVLPETTPLEDNNDNQEQQRHEKRRLWSSILQDILGPIKTFKYFLDIKFMLAIIYISLTFMSLYCISITLPYAYAAPPYNFTSLFIGLMYLGNCVGYFIGSRIGGSTSDFAVRRAVIKNQRMIEMGQLKPESIGPLGYSPHVRITSAWVGTALIPIGLLVYGWAIAFHRHYVIPLIGTCVFGIGLMVIQSTITPFLTDSVRGSSAASVVACMNLVKFLLAAAGSAFAYPTFEAIGNGWFMTVLAIIMIAAISLLVMIRILGQREDNERIQRQS